MSADDEWRQARLKNPPIVAPDHVSEARYVPDNRLFVRFADGHYGTWSFETLDLDMSHLKRETIKAATDGTAIEVKSKRGETVLLDTSAIRAQVDPIYAAEMNEILDALAKRIGL